VHSVVNRSPRELLEEIILVDDDSERGKKRLNLQNYNILPSLSSLSQVFSVILSVDRFSEGPLGRLREEL